ncbi:MAG: hypothetical protein IIU18_05275 [Oscillospiraceae bacterium]|nr:hypothetical protein [Oscillospiraceae bacterium]
MKHFKRSVLAGILAALLLLSGCGLFSREKEETPVPEEYQQPAVVVFE